MRAQPGSNSPAEPPQKAAPPSPQFTKSKQSSPSESPDRAKGPSYSAEGSAEKLSLDRTEPFPPGLFRVPVPDRLFAALPELSDAALRTLLALIDVGFRFDPDAAQWTRPERTFTRAEVQSACGLSAQGTRNGLSELAEAGYVEADRSGKTHRFALRVEVPRSRFTYLPTALFETAPDLTATELRLLLVIYRSTWGWTSNVDRGTGEGRARLEHRRWARLSTAELAERTGRSEMAIKTAASGLAGGLLRRRRPKRGAYYYRACPSALSGALGASQASGVDPSCQGASSQEKSSQPKAEALFSMAVPNEFAPDRPRVVPPSSSKESHLRDKHSQKKASAGSARERPEGRAESRGDAVPGSPTPGENSEVNLPEFSEKKTDLGRKLLNAGVWPGRVKECLRRYSEARIEANFELYRERASEIEDHGAWLCAAITDGYADVGGSKSRSSAEVPSHKQKVSAEERDQIVETRSDIEREHFHRFRHAEGRQSPEFIYFDPEVGGPARRTGRAVAGDP